MVKIKIGLNIEKNLYSKLKITAIKKNKKINELLEDMIRKLK